MLSIVVKILIEFFNMYQRLSSFPEIFLPIAAMLDEVLQGAKLPGIVRSNMEEVGGLIRKKSYEHQLSRQPLQMRKQKPQQIKLLNPKFEEKYVPFFKPFIFCVYDFFWSVLLSLCIF